jgi:hypothetical protein
VRRHAGYSGTPLVQKLGIKPGFRIFVANAPTAYRDLVGALPERVTLAARLNGAADMVHVFAMEAQALARDLPRYRDAIAPDGMVWVSWPKKAANVVTDVTENVIRDLALPLGLVDVKVCAVDATWSGLKLVVRRSERGRRGD